MTITRILTITIFALGGCIKSPPEQNPVPSLSPCIDGTLLDMRIAGCEEHTFASHPIGNYVEITCVEKTNVNYWTAAKFVVIPMAEKETLVPEGWIVHCIDQRSAMFLVVEPPPAAQ